MGFENDFFPTTYNVPTVGFGDAVWVIIAFVLSLIGCFVVYFLFVKKDLKNNNKYLVWLKDFLNFDKMLIETILKIAYIFVALFITLSSFALIGSSFFNFLMTLVFRNIIARVIYEALLITVMLWKNTTEIKNSLKK